MTQNEKVLHHLENHAEGITSMTAFQNYGITRLSARIKDLRDTGYKIITSNETSHHDGTHSTYARYTLVR